MTKNLHNLIKKTKKHCKSIHSKTYVPSLHACCVVIVLWCSGREPNTYLNEVNWGKIVHESMGFKKET